ncbi:MAG: hypothetical protein VB124_01125 [Burkholderia sp.]
MYIGLASSSRSIYATTPLGEVIDANRADTREAARAMFVKLADAS